MAAATATLGDKCGPKMAIADEKCLNLYTANQECPDYKNIYRTLILIGIVF